MTQPGESTDPTSTRRLDGNAAGGTLADLFAVDVTMAQSVCASCGGTSMLGSHHLYADAPAMVLRCPTCAEVVMRFASQDGRMLLDLRGAQLLTVPLSSPAEREPSPADLLQ